MRTDLGIAIEPPFDRTAVPTARDEGRNSAQDSWQHVREFLILALEYFFVACRFAPCAPQLRPRIRGKIVVRGAGLKCANLSTK